MDEWIESAANLISFVFLIQLQFTRIFTHEYEVQRFFGSKPLKMTRKNSTIAAKLQKKI